MKYLMVVLLVFSLSAVAEPYGQLQGGVTGDTEVVRAAVGKRFDAWSVELGYASFGSYRSDRLDGFAADYALDLRGKYRFYWAQGWNLYGLAGIARENGRDHVASVVTIPGRKCSRPGSAVITTYRDNDRTRAQIGIGAEHQLTDSSWLVLEYVRDSDIEQLLAGVRLSF